MRVWTVANQKGGVGKTTTAVTLAGLLVQSGKRVLLIDTDPHASLTYYFGIDSEELHASIYNVFTDPHAYTGQSLLDSLCATSYDNLFILAANMTIATLDRQLGSQSGMGLVLSKALASVADEFDHVIIDCPPILGILMVNALAASERIIVPVQTEYLALKGLERMMRTLHIMAHKQNQEQAVIIVPTMFDRRVNACLEALKRLKKQYPDKLWRGFIPIDTRFRDASNAQKPASFYAPRSRGVFAYTKLLQDLLS